MVHDWFHIFRLVVVKHYSIQSNRVSQSFSFTQKQKEKVVLKKGEKVFSFFVYAFLVMFYSRDTRETASKP